MRTRLVCAILAAALFLGLPIGAESPATDQLDLATIDRIKDEGLQRSKVMQTASYLTDVFGPRLTGSTNIRQAADWTERQLSEWGLANVHRETWHFGRGWENRRFVALAISPQAYSLIGYPKAWTPGTNGPVTAEAVLAVINSDKDFDTFRGKLRGKFVLAAPLTAVAARFEALGRRYTEADLAGLVGERPPRTGRGNAPQIDPQFIRRRAQFWVDEAVAAVLDYSRGDGGTLFIQRGGSMNPNDPPVAPQVTLAVEHYGRIARTLEKNIPVTLQMDIDNRFDDRDLNSFNVVAEIPGTDKNDEVVMVGAHLDSWHAGTGATDNAAGSAVMLEVMRILKAINAKPRRTIRLGLWTGEEEGLLGSREYVKAHLADPVTMDLKPEHGRLSVYFNLDNGTGLIRGVFEQENSAMAPIFSKWMEPFRDFGMTTLSMRGTSATDHASFDAVGIPAFQFIQDPIEYDSRTHHSNMDVYERLQPDDLMRNAVIIASFAYQAANREELLPRKPLPKPTTGTTR